MVEENSKLFKVEDLKEGVQIANANSIIPIVNTSNQVVGGVRNIRIEDGWLVGNVAILDEQEYQKGSIAGFFYTPIRYSVPTTEGLSDKEIFEVIAEIFVTKILIKPTAA